MERLQQALFHLLLARDAVLSPGHRFQPLLLYFFLAVGAHPVFVFLDAFESAINQVQEQPISIGHAEEKLFSIKISSLVRQVHGGIFVRHSSLFLNACNGLYEFFPSREQFFLVVIESFLVHVSPAPLDTIWGHLKTPSLERLSIEVK